MKKQIAAGIALITLACAGLTESVAAQETSETAKAGELQTAISSKIDSKVFASDGHIIRPHIAPDGTKIVYRENILGKTYLTTKLLAADKIFRVAMPENTELNWYRWAGSEKLLFSAATLKSYAGIEYRQRDLYVINQTTRKTRYLGVKDGGPNGDDVLFVDKRGKYLLLSTQESIYKYPSVFRINIDTNESEEVVRDQLKIWDWIADDKGVVRAGISYRRRHASIYYRSKPDENFKRIGKIRDNDDEDEREEELLDVTHIMSDRDDGYILSNKETGRFALYKFNYLTRETGEMVFGHDENDVTDFNLNEDGTALESVRYTDSRDRIKWFDTNLDKHQTMLGKALPKQEVWITSKSSDASKMVIYSTSPTDPGSYYLYEPEVRKMERFAGVNDSVDPSKLSVTKYEKYTARDGTVIPAYVTIPRGVEPKNLPLVILPHGGPFGVRDTLDYDREVQFLANRGYVVLQPNYRGSGSYGEKFYEKGEGQIGREMQDDLDDGMDWLAGRGVIDPKRVCIVGTSYGGYAALWGVTRNPERYRCAASFAGVTDWNKMLRYDNQFLKSRYRRELREKIEGEDDFDLDEVSPVKKVDQLIRPILLAQGKKDTIVPMSQFELYKEKLEDRSANAVFVTYEDEGHGLTNPENAKDWFDKLDVFLEKHNPA